MVDFNKLKSMDRRDFLKRGIKSGAILVSLPFWISRARRESEMLLAGEQPESLLLSKEDLTKLLQFALSRGGDFAEVYLEHTVKNNINLNLDKISAASRGLDIGVGFRVIKGEKTGYSFSENIDLAELKKASLTAALIADGPPSVFPQSFKTFTPPSYYLVEIAPDRIASERKADLLIEANASARSFDKRITQFQAFFLDTTKRIAIANSEGLYVEDTKTLTQFTGMALALDGTRRSSGNGWKVGTFGFEHYDKKIAHEIGREAADMAIRQLPAEDAPAGEFPIIIAKGNGGNFFHEAIGHSLEADGIRTKTSVFWDKLGKPIASPIVTLIDDGSYKGCSGSMNVDDEGYPGRMTVLIDKGDCAAFIQDKLTARFLKMEQTGNGRRQSFRFPPLPRMTNTYILPGTSDPEDIVKSVDKGLYIALAGAGNVNWATGQFVFSIMEGSMIEGGRVTKPIKNILLMGKSQDVLNSISMVGNDLLVKGGGSCRKGGQSIQVGSGNPTLKVDRILVAGR